MCLTVIIWFLSKPTTAVWSNVPPAPDEEKAVFLSLGDKQFAYRQNAFMLQNMGYGEASKKSFAEFNYGHLKDWFFLQDSLDPISDAIPMLAAYYYGAAPDTTKLPYVIEYLTHVGQRPIKEKWRWLARAVWLARYEMKDIDHALELSYLMAENENPDMADWAKQMPAFILAEKGEDKAAYQIMMNILITEYDSLHPNEINFMTDYICNKLLPNIDDIEPTQLCDSI